MIPTSSRSYESTCCTNSFIFVRIFRAGHVPLHCIKSSDIISERIQGSCKNFSETTQARSKMAQEEASTVKPQKVVEKIMDRVVRFRPCIDLHEGKVTDVTIFNFPCSLSTTFRQTALTMHRYRPMYSSMLSGMLL